MALGAEEDRKLCGYVGPQGYKLDMVSLRTLQPKESLDAPILNIYLNFLTWSFASIIDSPVYSHSLNPYFWTSTSSLDIPKAILSLLMSVVYKDMHYIFIPANTMGGSHWSLIVVDMRKRVIKHIDSWRW